jgi:hypothetical protein
VAWPCGLAMAAVRLRRPLPDFHCDMLSSTMSSDGHEGPGPSHRSDSNCLVHSRPSSGGLGLAAGAALFLLRGGSCCEPAGIRNVAQLAS